MPESGPDHTKTRVVVARLPKTNSTEVDSVTISHSDRQIWPGLTKLDLAHYWQRVAVAALPGIARRPLAVMRCPDGVDGEHFFQKNRGGYLPEAIRDGIALHQPYLAIDDEPGLVAMAQMSAIEIHTWGANEDDVAHPDRLVFDLDPGEGVAWPEVVQAALDMRKRLATLKLESFCRTSGGKGLHVVVPLARHDDWLAAKSFSRVLAETISKEEPTRFLAHTKIADRTGRILIDWLRNAIGATAIASFAPRARPGATVATPLAWSEVTPSLDPKAFTIQTVPARLDRQKRDPWVGFDTTDQRLPVLQAPPVPQPTNVAKGARPAGASRIVMARKPSRRS